MKFILENAQVIIVVVAIIVALVKQILEKKAPPEEPDWQPVEDHDHPQRPELPRMPPPLPQKRTMVADASELERQRKLQERLKALRDSKTPAPAAKSARKARPSAPALISPSKLKASLRDRNELRRAVILREILGPPVGLQTLRR